MCVSVWTNMNVLLHLNKQCVILYLTQRHVNMKNYHIIWRPSLISTDVVGSHHYEEALCLGSTFSLFKLTKSFCISLHKRELCIQCDHITNYFWIYHGIVTDTKKSLNTDCKFDCVMNNVQQVLRWQVDPEFLQKAQSHTTGSNSTN